MDVTAGTEHVRGGRGCGDIFAASALLATTLGSRILLLRFSMGRRGIACVGLKMLESKPCERLFRRTLLIRTLCTVDRQNDDIVPLPH